MLTPLYITAVTPRAGVWIEIELLPPEDEPPESLPVRECGLKYGSRILNSNLFTVTPRAGVWIEILQGYSL